MEHQCSTLGFCPKCEVDIPRRALLIKYRHDGWPTIFAECPSCGDVVHPR